jgi:hypothetical protein
VGGLNPPNPPRYATAVNRSCDLLNTTGMTQLKIRSPGMSQLIDGGRLPKFRTFALLSSLPGPLYPEDEDITILRKSVNIYQPTLCNIQEEQHSCENPKI